MFQIFLGFILGIALASLVHTSKLFLVFVFIIFLGFFLFSKIVSFPNKKIFILISLFSIGLFFGFFRIYFSNLYQRSELESFDSQKISGVGTVLDEPDVRETNQKLLVRTEKIFSEQKTFDIQEKILLTVPLYPRYEYGDRISFEVKLKKPDLIEGDFGRVFDYEKYLRVRDVWYTGSFAKINLLSSGQGSLIKAGLFKLKNIFTSAIDKAIPVPESALLSGLLLGTKQSLGKELLDEFSRAGVSHMVVLSGYNITIVANSLMAVTAFLGGTISFWIGCLVIILFTILSGGGASAWRAAIMVLIALFVKKTNRVFKVETAFALTISAMLLWNPLLLLFDPSFELSVLATIGIVFVAPHIEKYFRFITEKYKLREIFVTTISTQLVVLPFLIYTTGRLSLVALPVNILVLGSVPLAMLLGFITGILGIFSFWLSVLPGVLSYLLLWYELFIVHLGATFPGGSFELPVFSFWVVCLIYIVEFFVLRFLEIRSATYK